MGTEDDLCIDDFASSLLSHLPLDVLVQDVCVLGRCSRFWRDLCRSDSVWITLFRLRWPSLFSPPISDLQRQFPPPPWNPNSVEDWKPFYYERQSEMFSLAGVEKSRYAQSQTLAANHFGFMDVEQFSFCERVNLHINLTGLFYAIIYLQVPGSCSSGIL